MKYRKSLIVMLTMATMLSCSNDNEFNSGNSEYVNSVRVTVEDFQSESPSTRTAYTVDGSGFHFQWVEGDALGIYPVGGDQVKFPISNGDGAATASFDGGAWKLRSEYKYAAYYPFSVDNYKIDQKALPVSFTGQTQNGNGSTAHLGAYDYLACAATAPDVNGGVDLTMKHLGAFVRLQLTMPKADTYSSVTLESNGTKFVTAGTFDLTAATPTITPTATSSTYTINLTNVATTEKNQVITVYTIVAPANLSTSNITVTVHGTGKAKYAQTVSGKNFAARSAYNIAVNNFTNGTNNGHAYVDLGLPSGIKWATCNVGATSPEEYGDYFAWGETTSSKSLFYWSTYKWCNGSVSTITKYCNKDNKIVLDPNDDAAHVYWGSDWRMPTKEEQDELLSKCTWSKTSVNGVYGFKGVGPNGNSIFLPFAGYRDEGTLDFDGSTGCYWSSSRHTSNWGTAYYLSLNEIRGSSNNCERYDGHSVRAVCQ